MGRPQRLQCVVCQVTKSRSRSFPSGSTAAGCDHEQATCRECLRNSIAHDIEHRGPRGVACPQCGQALEHQYILRHSTAKIRDRYEQLLVRSTLQDIPEYVSCSAPGCDNGQIHTGGTNEPIVTCNACGSRTCFTHGVPWHTGISCEEYDAAVEREEVRAREEEAAAQQEAAQQAEAQRILAEGERASASTINWITKACPRCRRRIEKNGGCSHMRCTQCSYHFCWECLADYKEILRTDNSAHHEDCKFHTDNLARASKAKEDKREVDDDRGAEDGDGETTNGDIRGTETGSDEVESAQAESGEDEYGQEENDTDGEDGGEDEDEEEEENEEEEEEEESGEGENDEGYGDSKRRKSDEGFINEWDSDRSDSSKDQG